MTHCPHCGGELPRTLTPEEYNARAIPRLATLDALAARIDFNSFAWRNTPAGQRWLQLMDEQGKDEAAAGM
jgi:hypothetical protein